jgi:hypothetical protein
MSQASTRPKAVEYLHSSTLVHLTLIGAAATDRRLLPQSKNYSVEFT